MLFYHMICLIETGMAVKHFPGFITALYLFYHESFSCFSEKVGDFKTCFFYEHWMSVFKRNVVKLEKEDKIVLWLKRGQSLEPRSVWVLGGRLTNCSWCKNLHHHLSTSRIEKIILAAFMGNLSLNLHSLDHKWAAWLARFRCCANYSTAIYYRFSFVLCCSNWRQTVVETGPFFSESAQECLCCFKVSKGPRCYH